MKLERKIMCVGERGGVRDQMHYPLVLRCLCQHTAGVPACHDSIRVSLRVRVSTTAVMIFCGKEEKEEHELCKWEVEQNKKGTVDRR
jgi:hypothetical protein